MKAADLRAALDATRSLARHGRATDELTEARARAVKLLSFIQTASRPGSICAMPSMDAVADVHTMIVRACQGMGLPGLPARGPRPD